MASAAVTLAIAYGNHLGRQGYLGVLAQVPLCAIAAVLLARARRRVRLLSQRRTQLEAQLTKRP
jgi:hypothetical protein